MWLTLLSALGGELTLYSAMADANDTLRVEWVLSPEDGHTLSWLASNGRPSPKFVVQGKAEGHKTVTRTVKLVSQMGKVDLGGSDWPRGTQVSLSIQDEGGTFDLMRLNHQRGPMFIITALGGRQADTPPPSRTGTTQQRSSTSTTNQSRQPSRTPPPTDTRSSGPTQTARRSSSSSSSIDVGTIDPNAIIDAASQITVAILNRRQRKADEALQGGGGSDQAPRSFSDPVAKPTAKQVALDPEDPRTQACRTVAPTSEVATCISNASQRPHGYEEMAACGAFATTGFKRECVELTRKAPQATDTMTLACIRVFGPNVEGMRCLKVAFEAETPPTDDILACGDAWEDERTRRSCIARFRAIAWSPSEVLPACKTHFPADPVTCMHVAAYREKETSAIVASCGSTFGDEESGLECLRILRPDRWGGDATGTVPVCFELFDDDKQRLECISKARRDLNPGRIRACSDETKTGKRLKCVEDG